MLSLDAVLGLGHCLNTMSHAKTLCGIILAVHWPHVRNLVPHNVTYNWARHQETWLDR